MGEINNGFKEDFDANPKIERRDKMVATDKEAMDFAWFSLPVSETTHGYAKRVKMPLRKMDLGIRILIHIWVFSNDKYVLLGKTKEN